MIAFRAHFDGKVLIPDEPLDVKPQQRFVVRLEPIVDAPGPSAQSPSAFASIRGSLLSLPDNPHSRLTLVSDDELWGD